LILSQEIAGFWREQRRNLAILFWGEGIKPRHQPQDSGTEDLFPAKLKNIISLRNELAQLGKIIDWERLKARCATYYKEAGHPGLPDEAACER
jgi:hypothetical protein